MNISKLQDINAERAIRWHNNGETSWTLLEWAGAMCGEAGEAANFAKKLRRLEQSLPNKTAGLDKSNNLELRFGCAKEVADTIIYGLVILSKLGFDASLVLQEVFDRKSVEYGFPERAPMIGE